MEPFFEAYREVMPFLITDRQRADPRADPEPGRPRALRRHHQVHPVRRLHDVLPGLLDRRPVLRPRGDRQRAPLHLRQPRRGRRAAPGDPQRQGRRVALPHDLQLHRRLPARHRGHQGDPGSQARAPDLAVLTWCRLRLVAHPEGALAPLASSSSVLRAPSARAPGRCLVAPVALVLAAAGGGLARERAHAEADAVGDDEDAAGAEGDGGSAGVGRGAAAGVDGGRHGPAGRGAGTAEAAGTCRGCWPTCDTGKVVAAKAAARAAAAGEHAEGADGADPDPRGAGHAGRSRRRRPTPTRTAPGSGIVPGLALHGGAAVPGACSWRRATTRPTRSPRPAADARRRWPR